MNWKDRQDERQRRLEFKAREAKFPKCMDCCHYGPPLYEQEGRRDSDGKRRFVLVHECQIHPGCLNTDNSKGCEDFKLSRADLM